MGIGQGPAQGIGPRRALARAGHWPAQGIGHWPAQGIGRVPYFPENRYSNPKLFVNFLLPDRGFGEGWGGVKNLRLLQGLLYLLNLNC